MNASTCLRLGAVAALLLASSSALADPPAAVGMGNFRRAEVVQAARVSPATATVTGLTTANAHYAAAASLPSSARVLAVSGPTGKVTLVQAPLDKSQPVRVLKTAEANKLGLVTQNQARRLAEQNGGVLGASTKVKVAANGLAPGGYGYSFKQVSGVPFHPASYDQMDEPQETVTSLTRAVTFTGKGESATVLATRNQSPSIKLTPVVGPTNKAFVRSSATGALFFKEDNGLLMHINPSFKNNSWSFLASEYHLSPADVPAGYLRGAPKP